jgi:hypothetical protein
MCPQVFVSWYFISICVLILDVYICVLILDTYVFLLMLDIHVSSYFRWICVLVRHIFYMCPRTAGGPDLGIYIDVFSPLFFFVRHIYLYMCPRTSGVSDFARGLVCSFIYVSSYFRWISSWHTDVIRWAWAPRFVTKPKLKLYDAKLTSMLPTRS